jgi:lipoprotein NlpI
MRRCYWGAAILAVGLYTCPAMATTTRFYDSCLASNATRRLQIESCTFALTAEKLTPEQRALALLKRSAGYRSTPLWYLAKADLNEAAKLAPQNPQVLQALADSVHFDPNMPQAIAANQELVKRNPTDVKALSGLGMAYFMQQNYTQASNTFSRILAIDPNNPGALYFHAMALGPQQEFAKGLADMDRAVALQPKSIPFRQSRGEFELYAGRFADAVTDLDLVLAPNDKAPFHRLRGAAKYYLGDYQGAAADFASDMALVPNFRYLAVWRYFAEQRQGGGSLDELAAIADQTHDDWMASLIRLVTKQGSLEQALALAQSDNKALQMVQESQTHFTAAELAMMAGDHAAAKAQFIACRKYGAQAASITVVASPVPGQPPALPLDNVIEFAIAGARLQELNR